jgi:hypothetical protein
VAAGEEVVNRETTKARRSTKGTRSLLKEVFVSFVSAFVIFVVALSPCLSLLVRTW